MSTAKLQEMYDAYMANGQATDMKFADVLFGFLRTKTSLLSTAQSSKRAASRYTIKAVASSPTAGQRIIRQSARVREEIDEEMGGCAAWITRPIYPSSTSISS